MCSAVAQDINNIVNLVVILLAVPSPLLFVFPVTLMFVLVLIGVVVFVGTVVGIDDGGVISPKICLIY